MNANDSLRDFTGTEHYYKYGPSLLITDGIKTLCEKFQCFWFMDIVASYQPQLRNEEFQVWTLKKNEDDSAVVTCTDGNDKILQSQAIEFTDFKADEATIWVEFNVALLSSEH